ncbi:MAG: ribulose-phosphate 3-epimerase [Coriobacteriia bacterium]|nr:ribulose-phosphate 3-epimerase [Coriobacteriia bacterium]
MARTVKIAPSILSADFLNLERDVTLLLQAETPPEWLHIDVMDGHFVPNLTIGPPFVEALKKLIKKEKSDTKLDVHIMVDNPIAQLDWYLKAGADILTIHVESHAAAVANASAIGSVQPLRHKGTSYTITALSGSQIDELKYALKRIREAGALAGIALDPDTPAEVLRPLLGSFDVVMLMSVHPGFAGQSFIPSCLEKIAYVAQAREVMREKLGGAASAGGAGDAGGVGAAGGKAGAGTTGAAGDFLVEVDGGIDATTVAAVVEAGADVVVAGKAIYGAKDPQKALTKLRKTINAAL